MIKLSKLNGKEILVNSDQIEYIEAIPESKIMMMNSEYLLVTESMDTIVDRVVEYRQRCTSINKNVIRECLTMINTETEGRQ